MSAAFHETPKCLVNRRGLGRFREGPCRDTASNTSIASDVHDASPGGTLCPVVWFSNPPRPVFQKTVDAVIQIAPLRAFVPIFVPKLFLVLFLEVLFLSGLGGCSCEGDRLSRRTRGVNTFSGSAFTRRGNTLTGEAEQCRTLRSADAARSLSNSAVRT